MQSDEGGLAGQARCLGLVLLPEAYAPPRSCRAETTTRSGGVLVLREPTGTGAQHDLAAEQ